MLKKDSSNEHQLDSLQRKGAELRAENANLRDRCNNLSEEIDVLEGEVDRLKAKVKSYEEEGTSLNATAIDAAKFRASLGDYEGAFNQLSYIHQGLDWVVKFYESVRHAV
jgi:chromosome segregation ATPase